MGTYLQDHPNPNQRQFRDRTKKVTGCVVVHTAETPADMTGPDAGAENVAAFISRRSDPGSYHTLVDSDSYVRLVPYSMTAYGDGTGSNDWALHLSFACSAHQWTAQLTAEWRREALVMAAQEALRMAKWLWENYKIDLPARRISRTDSEKGLPGFISHGQRDPGRRSDPGNDFPWEKFLAIYADLKREWKNPRPVNTLTAATLNAHRQASLRKGALKQLDAKGYLDQLDVIFFQEITDLKDLETRLGGAWKVFPEAALFPDRPKDPRKEYWDPALAYVAIRRSTMKMISTDTQNITETGKHQRQMPIVTAKHRPTGKVIVLSSVHIQHGRRNFKIRELQFAHYAKHFKAIRPDRFGLMGGDFNETLQASLRAQAGANRMALSTGLRAAHSAVGMKNAGIDNFFFTPREGVKIVYRKEVRLDAMREGVRRGHPCVVVKFTFDVRG